MEELARKPLPGPVEIRIIYGMKGEKISLRKLGSLFTSYGRILSLHGRCAVDTTGIKIRQPVQSDVGKATFGLYLH